VAELVSATEGVRVSMWRNLAIVEIRESPTVAEARALLETLRARHAALGGPLGVLYRLRLSTAPTPGPTTREAYRQLMNDRDGMLAACAVLSEEGGSVGAMVVSVIAGLVLLARPRFHTRVFKEQAAAAGWLAREMQRREVPFGTAVELTAALEQGCFGSIVAPAITQDDDARDRAGPDGAGEVPGVRRPDRQG
jgi:hypothetical protein